MQFLRRHWIWLLVVLVAAAWYPAFRYLASFRPPDVIFVTTPPDVVQAMLDLAEVKAGDVVYDLGSGDGRIPIAAAQWGATAVGVEIDPELADQSRESAKGQGVADKVTIRRGDIFEEDLRPATVITTYLKPHLNAQLRPQIERCRPGTRVVSHMFSMPGAKPAKVIEVRSPVTNMEHRIYLWTVPLEDEAPKPRPPLPPATGR